MIARPVTMGTCRMSAGGDGYVPDIGILYLFYWMLRNLSCLRQPFPAQDSPGTSRFSHHTIRTADLRSAWTTWVHNWSAETRRMVE
jgi:hypothetical protein